MAELILAAVGAADLCLRYGDKLLKVYQAFKQADENIKAKILLIESTWSQMAIQVEFVQRIAHTMSLDHCRIHFEVLEMLQTKLQVAIKKVEPLLKENPAKAHESRIKRWKYVLVRESLDKTISDLEQWQRIFDPTWYLIILIKDKAVDSELLEKSTLSRNNSYSNSYGEEQGNTSVSSSSTLVTIQNLRNILKNVKNESTPGTHVTLPAEGLDWERAQKIPYSTTRLIPRMGSNKLFLVDTMLCDSTLDIPRARADAESLARKLKQVENANFGLLSCQGLVKRRTHPTGTLSSIDLVFKVPIERRKPVSLRSELLQRPVMNLSTVIDIARQLAMAVSFVHTCDFVHKNIRPETVLILANSDSELTEGRISPGAVQLLGFDRFRSVNFSTMRRGDTAWERNLYRHPLRQGLHAQEDYVMQHDVYSLGVCLLELGLWKSFVIDGKSEEAHIKDEDSRKIPSPTLGLTLDDFNQDTGSPAEPATRIKDHLVQLARSQLPQRMGNKYTAVVVTCLTCLDEENEDFGDQEDMRDEDGILIGVRFIEKILLRLSEISI
ncbi:uncharacterized protein GGS22DRAFT_150095 [Annulohypoxylon maeteangense]|uniref:uncharacterized protein n=1 Tax=Annulohypoxylon maeteangense TaxID=1927788 RepID=UPI002007E101|nr:uncharacterized protein GGS22DRAFT_150095 [Annulohypoxylon maeteangense]KAI0890144.1 hypothetical protein GGS22DRAFT_150095 [Annulohypoxylon maeteangense]